MQAWSHSAALLWNRGILQLMHRIGGVNETGVAKQAGA